MFHGCSLMSSPDDEGREFYQVWLTPARLVQCEQLYAGCQDQLRTLLSGLTKDIERREALFGIHDDSAQFAVLHAMIANQALSSAEDLQLTVNMFAAAMFKLVRASRTDDPPNPLAHLEDEGDNK